MVWDHQVGDSQPLLTGRLARHPSQNLLFLEAPGNCPLQSHFVRRVDDDTAPSSGKGLNQQRNLNHHRRCHVGQSLFDQREYMRMGDSLQPYELGGVGKNYRSEPFAIDLAANNHFGPGLRDRLYSRPARPKNLMSNRICVDAAQAMILEKLADNALSAADTSTKKPVGLRLAHGPSR